MERGTATYISTIKKNDVNETRVYRLNPPFSGKKKDGISGVTRVAISVIVIGGYKEGIAFRIEKDTLVLKESHIIDSTEITGQDVTHEKVLEEMGYEVK